ncbi:hypothetical protein CEW46_29245 [Bacillus cereus]|nr:hypothetical protein CEW46_29245 [Bacillus cereus]
MTKLMDMLALTNLIVSHADHKNSYDLSARVPNKQEGSGRVFDAATRVIIDIQYSAEANKLTYLSIKSKTPHDNHDSVEVNDVLNKLQLMFIEEFGAPTNQCMFVRTNQCLSSIDVSNYREYLHLLIHGGRIEEDQVNE